MLRAGRLFGAGAARLGGVVAALALSLGHPQARPKDQPLDLEAAVRAALRWHPSLAEAVGRLRQRAEQIDVARAGYRPQISVGVGSDFDDPVGAGLTPRATVSASQMLFDFGKVDSAVASARAGEEVGRARLLLAVDDLAADTADALIEVQRANALGEVARDQLKSVKAISDLVRDRYETGAATKSDALQARSRVEAARGTIAQLDAQRERWRARLAYLLGRSAIPEVTSDVPSWLGRACHPGNVDWSRVPALMIAEAEKDQADAELERAKAERLPTVSFGAGTSARLDAPFSQRNRYSVGINVSTDLYSGGGGAARARSAAYASQASNAAVITARNDVLSKVEQASRQVDSLQRVIDILRSRQDNMSETGKLYRMQYFQMGSRTLVDLLNAEQELHQSRFDLADVEHDLRKLEIDCLYGQGRLRRAFGVEGMVMARAGS